MSRHTLPKWAVVMLVAVFLLLPSSRVLAADPGTAFTYQGRLTSGGSDVNQSCDFQFSLYDASSSGSQVGSTLTKSSVSVSDGRFNTSLDFGSSAFTGSAGFLEIAVRCPAASGSYTTLSPRQELTPTPYAITAGGLDADGAKLTLDADDDTSITVDTDDQIDIEIGGSDIHSLTASTWTIASDLGVTLSGGTNGINFDSNTLSIDADNNRVGIGTASPGHTLDVAGTARFTGATLGVSGATTLADSVVIGTTDSTVSTSVFTVTTSVTSAGNTVFDLNAGGSLSLDGEITLGSAISGTSSHMYAVRGTNQTSVTSGTDVVFDTDRGSSGVTLNTSTGVFTLEATKIYVLEAALLAQWGATSSWQYGWTDSGGTTLTGAQDGFAYGQQETANASDQHTAKALITTTSATDVKLRVSNTGQTATIASNRSYAWITEVGTTDSTLSSDRRLKRDIKPLASISDDLARLQPVLFDWRSDEYPHLGLGTGKQLGLVAQDVEKVFPELVTEGADGFKRVSYEHIPMLLLQGIKDLKAENNALAQLVCADHPGAEVCQGRGVLDSASSQSAPSPGGAIRLWIFASLAAGLGFATVLLFCAYLKRRRLAIAGSRT